MLPTHSTLPPKKLPSNVTLKDLLGEAKTINVGTGLSREESEHTLHFLKGNSEPKKRGLKILELEVRLLITLQWLHLNQTYGQIGASSRVDSNRVQTSISSIWDRLKEYPVRDLIPKSSFDYKSRGKFINHLDTALISISKPTDREDDRAYYLGERFKS